MRRWKKYIILCLIGLCLCLGLIIAQRKICVECKKYIYYNSSAGIIFGDMSLDTLPFKPSFFICTTCFSSEKELEPPGYSFIELWEEGKWYELSREEQEDFVYKFTLHLLENYIKLGGNKDRPLFHVVYGWALLLNCQKDRAIEEFLKAPDDELDLNLDDLSKAFGKDRAREMMYSLQRVPRIEIIEYYEAKGDCEMALKQVRNGLQKAKWFGLTQYYKEKEEKIKKECGKLKEAKEITEETRQEKAKTQTKDNGVK